MSRLGVIVEGHGEEPAVPILLRRLVAHYSLPTTVIDRPIRIPRSALTFGPDGNPTTGRLERALIFLARKPDLRSILILADSDTDASCELAPLIATYAGKVVAHKRTGVVLALREFEAWFLSSIPTLRGTRGIREDAVFDGDPESMQGAKGRLESLMSNGSTYSPRTDQPALTDRIDIEMARATYSFDKLVREVTRLLATS